MIRRLKRYLNWRAALVYTHRWLGIAGCVLFVAWFVSGVVMMYARMPTLANEERLARADPLDPSKIKVTPAEAVDTAGDRGERLQVAMLGGRPIYSFGGGRGSGLMVFADTGELFEGIDRTQAEAAARRFEPQHTGSLRYDAYLTEPDQWTLQARASMPLHRFALDDAAGTELYVSEVTGEVTLRTTRRERFWGYLGPVIHWVYFTPLRLNGPLWSEFVIWSSLVGCVMCVVGLLWGLLRFSPSARFRLRRVPARSPYAGMMKWHHWAGLLFGVITFTWTYSGLLSMGPFDWFQPTGGRGGRQAREASSGGMTVNDLSIDGMRAAHDAFSRSFVPKSMEVMRFQGELYWAADRSPLTSEADAWRSPSLNPRAHAPPLERLYVSAARPEEGTFASFPRDAMPEVAHAAMPGVPVADSTWLTEYDGYYYNPSGTRSLPVLRVRYADPQQTWIYLDPASGGIVQRSESITRLRRWLYQGLHSLDFPFLYYRRPLWDIVVILLSIGGLVLSATTITPAWRRLKRHVAGWAAVFARRRPAPARQVVRP